MIALRLRRRRDGSLCLTDAAASVSAAGRSFPDPHSFTYEWLAENMEVVKLDGDLLTLTFANAAATYRVTERRANGCDVELVDSKLFDAPPVDEKKAAEIAAEREVIEIAAADVASIDDVFGGSVKVEEG